MISKEGIKKRIEFLYSQITQRDKKTFDPVRTQLFGELIFLVKKYNNLISVTELKKQINTEKLWQIFSIEQMCIEKYWSRKIISSKNPSLAITKFPFYRNYISSADYLFKSLLPFFKKPLEDNLLLYVGAGALPLNSILLAQKYHLKIHNVERDYPSFRLSTILIKKMKLDDQIKTIHTDIIKYKDLKKYNAILCAILVGKNIKERHKVIEHISKYMNHNSILMLKNVDGLRSLLYPQIDVNLLKNFSILRIYRKQSELTNILIIAKKIR